MALTNSIWQSSGAWWIAQEDTMDAGNLYLQFARTFELDRVQPLQLHISAVSQYRVSVNGHYIGRGPAVASQTHYYFHEYCVPMEFVQKGRNTITVLVFHDGEKTQTLPEWHFGKPGLLVHLGGESCSIVSDEQWLVRRAPMYSAKVGLACRWIGHKEYYRGDLDEEWESPESDYSDWGHAVKVAPPVSPDFVSRLVPLDVPELQEKRVRPVRVAELTPNLGRIALKGVEAASLTLGEIVVGPGEPFAAPTAIFDFGKTIVGYPEVTLEGGPCTFEVWYGETLDLCRLDAVHLPSDGQWRAFQRRAFRFLKLKFVGLGGEVTVKTVCQNTAQYAYNKASFLETSDERMSEIMQVSLDTLYANTSYHYEDCPIREQALWVLDMRIMALFNAYMLGNHELTAKCIRQSFAIQREDGAVPATGPKFNRFFFRDFMFHAVATLAEHYKHTGDSEIVSELSPALMKLHDHVRTWLSSDGLIDTTDWPADEMVFQDWNDRIEKRGKTTYINALYVLYLEDLADLMDACDKGAEAQRRRDEAEAVRRAVRDLLFLPDKGLFCDAWRDGERSPVISQQANLTAVLAGIPTDEEASFIAETVLVDETCIRPGSPSTYWVVFEALAKVGNLKAIESVIREYWGAMLDRGATTWWEVFDPDTPAWTYPHPYLGHCPSPELDWVPVSCCHAWSAIPGYAIPRYLLGVDLSEVYLGKITVRRNQPLGLDRTDYKLPIADGLLHLRFGQGDGNVKVIEKPQALDVICRESTCGSV